MANTMKALQTVTVGAGGVSSVTFSNIPQNYTDLVIKMSVRSAYAGIYDIMNVQINGSTTVLATRQIYGTGTAAASDNTTIATNVAWLGYPQANSATANTFGNQDIYIPNYVGSNYKSISYDSVDENNATASMMYLGAGLWSSANPITSLSFSSANGSNWLQYSTFTLYGVFNQDVIAAPAAPTIGTATAGIESASVTFTGVSGAASYTMTSSPGSITATGTTSPITLTGLTGGTAYTFTCTANNPLGSSAASAASNSVTPTTPAYSSIATVTVGSGGASSISFTGIPSGYTHLQIRYTARGTIADVNSDIYCWLNGDTTQSKYSRHYLRGNGSAASAGSSASSTTAIAGTMTGANSTSGIFGVGIIDILDYSNTNKYKTTRSLSGEDQNGSGNDWLFSNLFMDTAAVSSLSIVPQSNGFAQYSQFALYGIKGA